MSFVWIIRSEWYVWLELQLYMYVPSYSLIGRHCSLWCEITADKLSEPRKERGRYPARTLQWLQQDHQRFMEEGGGNLKKAKLFNNVISKHFFDIPIDSVCTIQNKS